MGGVKRSFEEFTGRGSTVPSEQPRVTLQRNGKIGLNQAALRALGQPGAVVLLFDSTTHSVGLRATTKSLPHAYPVLKHAGAATVTAIAFAKHYSIDLSETRSFPATFEDGVLVIDLNKGVPSGRARTSE